MNIRHLNLNAMLNCLEIENLGSINSAAQRLHVSQPTLSRNVRSLEDGLGLELFRRTPTGVEPTVFGNALLHHTRVIQSELLRCIQDLHELQTHGRASLQVGGTPAVIGRIMTRAALELMQKSENVNVGLVEALPEELYPLLLRGAIDLFVASIPAEHIDDSIEITPLFSDAVGIVVGARHPLSRRKKVGLASLIDKRWVMPVKAGHWQESLTRQLAEAGIIFPTHLFQTNSFIALRQALIETDLIAFVPLDLVRVDLEAGTLRLLRTDWQFAPAHYSIYARRIVALPELVAEFKASLIRITGMETR